MMPSAASGAGSFGEAGGGAWRRRRPAAGTLVIVVLALVAGSVCAKPACSTYHQYVNKPGHIRCGHDRKLFEVVHPEMDLEHLHTFELYRIRFSVIPEGWLDGCTNLKLLRIQGETLNSIYGDSGWDSSSSEQVCYGAVGGCTIPAPFTSLPNDFLKDSTQLETLEIVATRLTSVPTGFLKAHSKMKMLMLAKSPITQLPDSFLQAATGLERVHFFDLSIEAFPARCPSWGFLSNGYTSSSSRMQIDFKRGKLKELPVGWLDGPLHIYTFLFGGNAIAKIPSGVLANAQVQIVELQNNVIASVPEDWLAHTKGSLRHMWLYNNRLTRIPDGFLSGAHPELVQVKLYNNLITEIPSDFLKGSEKLKVLQLDRNYITQIGAGAFNGLVGLDALTLNTNRLTEVSLDNFAGLAASLVTFFNNRIGQFPTGMFDAMPERPDPDHWFDPPWQTWDKTSRCLANNKWCRKPGELGWPVLLPNPAVCTVQGDSARPRTFHHEGTSDSGSFTAAEMNTVECSSCSLGYVFQNVVGCVLPPFAVAKGTALATGFGEDFGSLQSPATLIKGDSYSSGSPALTPKSESFEGYSHGLFDKISYTLDYGVGDADIGCGMMVTGDTNEEISSLFGGARHEPGHVYGIFTNANPPNTNPHWKDHWWGADTNKGPLPDGSNNVIYDAPEHRYRFTIKSKGSVTFDSCLSEFGTALSVYDENERQVFPVEKRTLLPCTPQWLASNSVCPYTDYHHYFNYLSSGPNYERGMRHTEAYPHEGGCGALSLAAKATMTLEPGEYTVVIEAGHVFDSTTMAPYLPRHGKYALKMTCGAGATSLRGDDERPGGLVVDSELGSVSGAPENIGSYTMGLYAVDSSGARAKIEQWEFEVVNKLRFALVDTWDADSMTDTILSVYVVGTSYTIPGPKVDAMFENAKGGVSYKLLFTSTHGSKPSPSDFLVDTSTGKMLFIPTEDDIGGGDVSYNVSLLAVDGNGDEVVVKSWPFSVRAPKPFATTDDWSSDSMAANIYDAYTVGISYTIPGPTLAKAEMFANPALDNFSAISYKLQFHSTAGAARFPQDFLVDTATGKTLYTPVAEDILDGDNETYTVILEAVDKNGAVAEVYSYTFKVEKPPQTEECGPNQMRIDWGSGNHTDDVAQGKCGTLRVFSYTREGQEGIKGALDPDNVSPTQTYEVGKVLRIKPIDKASLGLHFDVEVKDGESIAYEPWDGVLGPDGELSFTLGNAPLGFLIDPHSGYIQGTPVEPFAGNMDLVVILTRSGARISASVQNIPLFVEYSDIHGCEESVCRNSTFGPDGQTCEHDGTFVDGTRFDRQFTCDCPDLDEYKGDRCELKVEAAYVLPPEATYGTIASLVAASLLIIAVVKYRAYRERMRPIDFDALNRKMLANGTVLEDQLFSDRTPRELKRSNVVLLEQVGSGAFGAVWKAMLDESAVTGRPEYQVAAKTVLDAGASAEATDDLTTEAAVMAQLTGHRNLVSLIGVVTSGNPLILVLSYCDHGSMLNHLKKCVAEGKAVTAADKIDFGAQTARGMGHLSGRHFIHRDLAARNVLLTSGQAASKLVCKVADFGLSRGGGSEESDGSGTPASEDYYRSQKGVFPVRWTAPEAMETLVFTRASDVWSFGVLLVELVQDGDRPYHELKSNVDVMSLTMSGHRCNQPPGCSDSLYMMMLRCWDTEPKNRPSFTDLASELDQLHGHAVAHSAGDRGTCGRTDGADGSGPNGAVALFNGHEDEYGANTSEEDCEGFQYEAPNPGPVAGGNTTEGDGEGFQYEAPNPGPVVETTRKSSKPGQQAAAAYIKVGD